MPVDDDGLDVDALEQLLARHEIRMLALQPRLHNPTGRDLSPERRARLLELARRHGFFILEDGVYGDLRFEGEDAGRAARRGPRRTSIYVDSLSKTLGGGTAARLGRGRGPVLDRIVAAKRADDIHSPTLTQLAPPASWRAAPIAAQAERARDSTATGWTAMQARSTSTSARSPSSSQPLGGGHLWLGLDLPLDERVLADEAVQPGRRLRARRRDAARASAADLHLRLSFGFLEPEEMRRGAPPPGVAIRSLRARPARRQAVPV